MLGSAAVGVRFLIVTGVTGSERRTPNSAEGGPFSFSFWWIRCPTALPPHRPASTRSYIFQVPLLQISQPEHLATGLGPETCRIRSFGTGPSRVSSSFPVQCYSNAAMAPLDSSRPSSIASLGSSSAATQVTSPEAQRVDPALPPHLHFPPPSDLEKGALSPVEDYPEEPVKELEMEKKEAEDPWLVRWEKGEMANPMNWSRGKRWYLTFLVSSCVYFALVGKRKDELTRLRCG